MTRPPTSMLRRLAETILLGGGVLLLVFVGGVRLDAWRTQRLAARQLRAPAVAAAEAPAPPAPGSPVAKLSAAELSLDVVALEGVGGDVLRRGAGHFPGTALPGSPGNAAFAAHRDTFFRGLAGAEPGQRIRVETRDKTFLYAIESTRIVSPDAVEVVGPRPGGSFLTLVTCYPFDWIGPAPQRFVVRAALLGEEGTLAAEASSGPALLPERTSR
ncbi:MAG: class D sortase [Thermoanaerobaculia bacterium]